MDSKKEEREPVVLDTRNKLERLVSLVKEANSYVDALHQILDANVKHQIIEKDTAKADEPEPLLNLRFDMIKLATTVEAELEHLIKSLSSLQSKLR